MDTLFRGNSIACKVLSLSFKTFGLYYLQSVVRPLIIQLMKCNDKDFEVDPARLTDPEKLQRNQLNLLELVQTFYTTILSSLPSLPLQLRTVCHTLFTVRMLIIIFLFCNWSFPTHYIARLDCVNIIYCIVGNFGNVFINLAIFRIWERSPD